MLEKISKRVYFLPHDETVDRPRLGYIQGDQFSIAVDAGNSKAHVEKFYAAIEKEGLKIPEFTAITHWHWDHTFGMHGISGRSIVGKETQKILERVSKWAWTEDAMAQRLASREDIEFCDQFIRVEYPDRKAIRVITGDIVFEGKMVLDLGGVHCVLIPTIAPHSKDSVLVQWAALYLTLSIRS